MITFKRTNNTDVANVHKHGVQVAVIRKADKGEQSPWGNIMLIHNSGRIDRHHLVSNAKSDAMKI
jgi:hypothetical protein